MDRDKPFVGAHTPKITLPGDGQPAGIVQGQLALRKGKQYVGRIWLAGDPTAAPVKVSLVWGDGEDQRQTITIDTLAAITRKRRCSSPPAPTPTRAGLKSPPTAAARSTSARFR